MTDDRAREGSASGLRVLITGACGGIGSAARELLESRGAQVVGLDRVPGRDADVVADVRETEAVTKAVAEAVERLGGLDVLVNSAGVGDPVDVGAMPGPEVERVLDINLLGTWRVTSAALPALLESGGRVICIASGLAYVTMPFASAYAASKRAVTAYADALRLEYGGRISVTTLYPGYIQTPIHASSEAAGLRLGEAVPHESLDDAARAILRASAGRRPRRDTSLTRVGAATRVLSRHMPRTVDRTVVRQARKFARDGRLGTAPYASALGERLGGGGDGRPDRGELSPPSAPQVRAVAAADGLPLHAETHPPLGGSQVNGTVVLVHGYEMSTRCWHRQLHALPRHLDGTGVALLAYDHRGHGRSAPSARDQATIAQLADDLVAVLGQAAPDGPLVLVGHSMGGMTLMALAERHPEVVADRVAGVVLMSTSPGLLGELTFGLPKVFSPVMKRAVPTFHQYRRAAVKRGRQSVPTAVNRALIRRLAFGRDPRPMDVRLVADLSAATSPDTAADFHITLTDHDRVAALQVFSSVPTLLLSGTRDLLCPHSHSRRMAEALPDAELVTYPDAGHMLMLERDEDVTRRIAEFTRSCVGVRVPAASHESPE